MLELAKFYYPAIQRDAGDPIRAWTSDNGRGCAKTPGRLSAAGLVPPPCPAGLRDVVRNRHSGILG